MSETSFPFTLLLLVSRTGPEKPYVGPTINEYKALARTDGRTQFRRVVGEGRCRCIMMDQKNPLICRRTSYRSAREALPLGTDPSRLSALVALKRGDIAWFPEGGPECIVQLC